MGNSRFCFLDYRNPKTHQKPANSSLIFTGDYDSETIFVRHQQCFRNRKNHSFYLVGNSNPDYFICVPKTKNLSARRQQTQGNQ